MEKLSNIMLLRDPESRDIVANLKKVEGLDYNRQRGLCEEALRRYRKVFAAGLGDFSQPREMGRYSENPTEFTRQLIERYEAGLPLDGVKGFRMEMYAAIALYYLKQFDQRDTRSLLAVA